MIKELYRGKFFPSERIPNHSNPEYEKLSAEFEKTLSTDQQEILHKLSDLHCSDTEKGADASAAVMSIIETAKRNNLDVYGYLKHLLTVLPEWGRNPTDEQLESVMPWSESLPDFCRQ